MDCRKEENLLRCPCPSTTCERRSTCCHCLAAHLSHREFPACVFPNDGKKHARSFESFARLVAAGAV
ncbi:MAG: DUF6485 family protein [Candidatus Latescibacterota bacterium]